MQLNGLTGFIYKTGEWAIRLFYTNLLWIFFTLLGLGVFGLMPATVSLFAVLRQWIIKKEDFPIFRSFLYYYRKEFIKSNLFGLLFLVVGSIIRVDIIFLKESSTLFLQILSGVMLCIGLLYFIILLYFFPVYVHFDISFTQHLKYALIIGVSQVSSTIMMVLGLALVFCLYWYISGLIPLFFMSLFSLNLMWFGYRSFVKIEYELQQV
ncbi:YesL family protein [Gracilibacillus sp. D59]|uniref:YesL family protein n=1 Tax=Gracilibacillus sp. D59 TaxID=3457434 RepID=UPI003FCD2889